MSSLHDSRIVHWGLEPEGRLRQRASVVERGSPLPLFERLSVRKPQRTAALQNLAASPSVHGENCCLIALARYRLYAQNPKMKRQVYLGTLLSVLAVMLATNVFAVDRDLARFATLKENQIRKNAETLANKVPTVVWKYFDAVKVDDWDTATNLAERINQASGRYTNSMEDDSLSPALKTLIWPSISEMIGTYEQFHTWNNKWLHRFGKEIIDSIPQGSVYFGGTDPGRFIISALTEPNADGKHFFVLTQNQLVDGTYLAYLRKRYGKQILIPTDEDLEACFHEYVADAKRRMKEGRLAPGEDVRDLNGRTQVSGTVAVMKVNGMLAKRILDENPHHQFFIEESYAVDWMYPYLSPHGLIFELHHKPLDELRAADVQKDRDYWDRLAGELIGGWLTNGTPVSAVCEFSDKVFLDEDLDGFKGDEGFVKNEEARKCFSKLRSSLAGLYAWRAEHARDSDTKARMRDTADLAFRQAYAICPSSPEAIYRYVQFLVECKKPDKAFLLAKTSLRLDPENQQLRELITWIRSVQ